MAPGCVYSGVKLFVFKMNSSRRFSISVCFIYGLEEKNSKSGVIFSVCCLPLTSCLTSLLSILALYRQQWMRRRNYRLQLVLCNPHAVGIDIFWGGRPCSFSY